MTDSTAASTTGRWDAAAGADPLAQLVHLSNLVGRDRRLVQPGGGNSSIKVELKDATGRPVPALLVKGSGTDLRTVGPGGFARLSLDGLGILRTADMNDAEMMRLMAGCRLGPEGPPPSVETPLHSLLPHRVIVHTHDVATMSLTNLEDGIAERLVGEVFEGGIVYVPYVRPGVPLARAVSQLAPRIPATAQGLALAHHGLVVWGDDPRQCHERLLEQIGKVEAYLESQRRGRLILGPARRKAAPLNTRHAAAEAVLPVIRGVLGNTEPVVLELDEHESLLKTIDSTRLPQLTPLGVATPEHILRAGRRPLWLELDLEAPASQLVESARAQLATQRAEYEAYHRRYAASAPMIPDWAKVILVPGLGMITAGKDKSAARTAGLCYRATLEAIENAEALGGFSSIPEADVHAFEHWPLERRKVEEGSEQEKRSRLVPRRVAVVIGGGSGIGEAASLRFAEEGAHVVVADLDFGAAQKVAAAILARFPHRALAVEVDVRSDASLAELFGHAVREFGGVDALFYTAGLAPRFAPVTELTREDMERQMAVHYIGAVRAVAEAAKIMRRQGRGGAIIASVSKAALAPGKDAAAYGASKAAMWQALKVAAMELGGDGIRINAINADQIDTPLFQQFVRERAARSGISFEEQLEKYRGRNLMGASLIPAEVVADLAVLLASDRFRFTTGDILTVDGGLPDAFPR